MFQFRWKAASGFPPEKFKYPRISRRSRSSGSAGGCGPVRLACITSVNQSSLRRLKSRIHDRQRPERERPELRFRPRSKVEGPRSEGPKLGIRLPPGADLFFDFGPLTLDHSVHVLPQSPASVSATSNGPASWSGSRLRSIPFSRRPKSSAASLSGRGSSSLL